MGEMTPISFQQDQKLIETKYAPIVKIKFELEEPVRSDLYDFIVNN